MNKKASQIVRARRRQLRDAQMAEYKAEMKPKTYPKSIFTALTDPVKFGLEKRAAKSAREEAERAFLRALGYEK